MLSREGTTMIEYALIAALVSIVVAGSFGTVASSLTSLFQTLTPY
ncbi:MAG: Flp family type IVb pilin [Alphaproteobacteria bacterium]|nr:Flp family type IVb pilin [Alphaproteobacteria bacterium]